MGGKPAETATSDRAFLQAMLDAEAALARVQDQAAGETVTAVTSSAARFDARSLALRAQAGGNPVIPLVADLTAAVAERVPEHAEFVHRGATSQDILDSALMLMAARALDLMAADLAHTADVLGTLAAGHRHTPMPGRTLTQHAVPTTFGLKAAGWRALVLDAQERLARVRASLPAQLGGAAGTLAAFGDQGLSLLAAYARETGLAEPELPWHVLRTPIADLGAALAFCAGALGKIAADVLVLSRTEVGELAEGSGGGSSAMPHKNNPARATLIASAARQVPPRRSSWARWSRRTNAPRSVARGMAAPARGPAADGRGGAGDDGPVLGPRGPPGPDAGRPRPHRRTDAHRTPPDGASADAGSRGGAPPGDGGGAPCVTAGHRPLPGPGADDPAPAETLARLGDASRYLGSAPALVDRALSRGCGHAGTNTHQAAPAPESQDAP